MSVRVISWVWEHSQSSPIQRLVLLAIADCANDRGTDAYPATSTLAKKTGLSERGVRKAVSELAAIGELRVDYKAGPRGVNRFRIVMPDLASDAGSDPEPDAGSEGTRHVVPEEPRARSTRNEVPGSRNVVPGTWHETSVDPARGAPKPSKNRKNKEPPLPPKGGDSDPAFDTFWATYPRKVGKPNGLKAWRAAIKRGHDPGKITAAARRYAETRRGQDAQYTAHPATWLNGERYNDPEPQVTNDEAGWWNN